MGKHFCCWMRWMESSNLDLYKEKETLSENNSQVKNLDELDDLIR